MYLLSSFSSSSPSFDVLMLSLTVIGPVRTQVIDAEDGSGKERSRSKRVYAAFLRQVIHAFRTTVKRTSVR